MHTIRFAPRRYRRWTATYWAKQGMRFGKVGKWVGITFVASMIAMAGIITCLSIGWLAALALAELLSATP